MTRIVDYTPSNEHGIVSRILLAVHKTADRTFPASGQRQYAKTAVAADANPRQPVPPIPVLHPEKKSQVSPVAFVEPRSGVAPPAMSHTTREDSDFDFLVSEKQKSRRFFFMMIVLATTAFVALALLLSSRNFGNW
ncbi:MAG: hypothetical protein RIQ81_2408 [Pseudomonadota bacterium]